MEEERMSMISETTESSGSSFTYEDPFLAEKTFYHPVAKTAGNIMAGSLAVMSLAVVDFPHAGTYPDFQVVMAKNVCPHLEYFMEEYQEMERKGATLLLLTDVNIEEEEDVSLLGIFAPRYERKTLFTIPANINLSEIPRWMPRIDINQSLMEDEDGE